MSALEKPVLLKDVYPQFSIGDGTYGDLKIFWWPGDPTKIFIGPYCSFSFGVKVLLGGGHRLDWGTTYPFSAVWAEANHIEGHPTSRGDVMIGGDVWVGAEAMVLAGVNIGAGAVVGARSLVNKSVEPYAIVAGNPARQIGWRFPEREREDLLLLEWWYWPRERIVKALPYLLKNDVRDFLKRAAANEF